MNEESGSGSVPLTNRSGYESRRPKKVRIRIHDTGVKFIGTNPTKVHMPGLPVQPQPILPRQISKSGPVSKRLKNLWKVHAIRRILPSPPLQFFSSFQNADPDRGWQSNRKKEEEKNPKISCFFEVQDVLSAVNFFHFLVIKILDTDPDPRLEKMLNSDPD
jgi:hypothetical protein